MEWEWRKSGSREAHEKVSRAREADFWSRMRRAMWWWEGGGMEDEEDNALDGKKTRCCPVSFGGRETKIVGMESSPSTFRFWFKAWL